MTERLDFSWTLFTKPISIMSNIIGFQDENKISTIMFVVSCLVFLVLICKAAEMFNYLAFHYINTNCKERISELTMHSVQTQKNHYLTNYCKHYSVIYLYNRFFCFDTPYLTPFFWSKSTLQDMTIKRKCYYWYHSIRYKLK